jgi:hypothetical protein
MGPSWQTPGRKVADAGDAPNGVRIDTRKHPAVVPAASAIAGIGDQVEAALAAYR